MKEQFEAVGNGFETEADRRISLALEGYKHRKLEHNPGKEFRNQS